MGCNARVCTPGTRLGLPELSLGKRQLQGRAGRGLRHDASFLLRPSNCRQDGVPALPSCHMCPFYCAGILPGFGGTQRLPRLVGLKKAVEMMLTSQVRGREGGAAVPGGERVYSLTGRRERGMKVLQRGEAFFYSCCRPSPFLPPCTAHPACRGPQAGSGGRGGAQSGPAAALRLQEGAGHGRGKEGEGLITGPNRQVLMPRARERWREVGPNDSCTLGRH